MIKHPLTTDGMLFNILCATDNEADVEWFNQKVDYYLNKSDYAEKMKHILIETAYESIVVRIALETIPDKTERAAFYIENDIVYETAKTIEEAILPLLEKYKREGK